MLHIKAQEAAFAPSQAPNPNGHSMNLTQARDKLRSIGQEHLLAFWDSLHSGARDHLLDQIEALNISLLKVQQTLVDAPYRGAVSPNIAPLQVWDVPGSLADQLLGAERIAQGKVGCIVVAGGQGTRLGYHGPKGMFPITRVKHKTLFQLLAERIQAAGNQAGRDLPFAIMTSPHNDEITRLYFKENDYFGLAKEQLQFFVQGTLPLIGESGQLLLQAPGTIAVGPDGNGWALHHFFHSGIWEQWQQRGVEELTFIQVDNSLADPFDAELIGYHARQKVQVTLKATKRSSVDEKVGLVVEVDNRIAVVEYTELPQDEKEATNVDGSLQYQVANLSMFCFSMEFIALLCSAPMEDFPLHLAHKPATILDESGQLQEIKSWKCERFIFDVLRFANKVSVLVYPRDRCYAALKNGVGADSLAEAQAALLNLDRRTYTQISGVEVSQDRQFELAPQFYYPTAELLQKWKGVPLPPDDYIDTKP